MVIAIAPEVPPTNPRCTASLMIWFLDFALLSMLELWVNCLTPVQFDTKEITSFYVAKAMTNECFDSHKLHDMCCCCCMYGFRERAGDFLLIKQVQKRLSAPNFRCQRNSCWYWYLLSRSLRLKNVKCTYLLLSVKDWYWSPTNGKKHFLLPRNTGVNKLLLPEKLPSNFWWLSLSQFKETESLLTSFLKWGKGCVNF